MTEQVKDAPSDAEKLSGGGAAKTSSTVKVEPSTVPHQYRRMNVQSCTVLFGVLLMIFVGR